MIAPDRREITGYQDIGGARRVERAAEVVAKIDDVVDSVRRNIGKHGFKGQVVAVDIGDHCNFHIPVLRLNPAFRLNAALRAFPST